MRARLSFLAFFIALLALPAAVSATTIEVTGVVTDIYNNTLGLSLDGSVAIGTTYTATYTYDPNLFDTYAVPSDAFYGPLTSFEITLGNYVIGNVGASSIRVTDGLFGFDYYAAQMGLGIVQSGSLGGPYTSLWANLAELTDPTATAFSSEALQVPDFSGFSSATWKVTALECECDPESLRLVISGTLTSIREVPDGTTAVPEPATMLLVAMGGGMSLLRRRFRKNTP